MSRIGNSLSLRIFLGAMGADLGDNNTFVINQRLKEQQVVALKTLGESK